jgi:hypothetical protein
MLLNNVHINRGSCNSKAILLSFLGATPVAVSQSFDGI